MPRRTCASWTRGIASDSTARTSSAWRRSASPCPTCRSTSARRGSRIRRSGSSRPWRRCPAWPSSRSGSGRTGSAGASRSWSWRWPSWPSRPWLLRGAQGTVWLGLLGHPVRRERHLPRRRREPLRGRGGGPGSQGRCRRGPRSPAVLEADRHRAGGPGRELDVGAVRRRRDPAAACGRAGPGCRRRAPDPRTGDEGKHGPRQRRSCDKVRRV